MEHPCRPGAEALSAADTQWLQDLLLELLAALEELDDYAGYDEARANRIGQIKALLVRGEG
jgi:hypothetical protein